MTIMVTKKLPIDLNFYSESNGFDLYYSALTHLTFYEKQNQNPIQNPVTHVRCSKKAYFCFDAISFKASYFRFAWWP